VCLLAPRTCAARTAASAVQGPRPHQSTSPVLLAQLSRPEGNRAIGQSGNLHISLTSGPSSPLLWRRPQESEPPRLRRYKVAASDVGEQTGVQQLVFCGRLGMRLSRHKVSRGPR